MRTLIQKSACMLTVFIISLCVMTVMAQAGKLLLDENFEEYDVGSGPADWGEKWLIVTNPETMTAANDVVHSGQRSLKVDSVDLDCRICRIFDEETTENVITLEFYVYSIDDTVRSLTFAILGGDPLNPVMNNNPGESSWGPFLGFLNIGDIAYVSGGVGWTSSVPYQANQWYHIKVLADVSTNSFDLYLDNMNTPVEKDVGFKFDQENLCSIVWHRCYAYFDDILAYEGTENPKAVAELEQKIAITWGRIKRLSICQKKSPQ